MPKNHKKMQMKIKKAQSRPRTAIGMKMPEMKMQAGISGVKGPKVQKNRK